MRYLFLLTVFITVISCTKKNIYPTKFSKNLTNELKDVKKVNGNGNEVVKNDLTVGLSDEVLSKEVAKLKAFDVTPGYHKISIDMDPAMFKKGVDNKRYFSYYIPSKLKDKFDLLFELHGNFSRGDNYFTSTLNEDHFLTSFYDTTNVVVVKPIGSILKDDNPKSVYGWYTENGDLNYIDFLIATIRIKLKEKKSFDLNENGIFSTGHSSGAIFSWGLTYYRQNVFAAVVPRFGQVKIKPEYKVGNYKMPMRVLLGDVDQTVNYDAASNNLKVWVTDVYGMKDDSEYHKAQYYLRYAGYNPKKSKKGTLGIDIWKQKDAVVEMYTLHGCGHGLMTTALQYQWNDFVHSFLMAHHRHDK